MRRVLVVIPAHNEAPTVAETVHALRGLVDEVVVVADACTDDTADQARGAGAVVLVRSGRGDKARALAMGLNWVARQNPGDTDIVLLVDADTGSSAQEAVVLAGAVASGADMAIGVLPPAGWHGGFGLVARLARRILWQRTGIRFRAPLSGQRAIRWSVLRNLHALAGGFGVEVGMTLDLLRLGARVREVEVHMSHRHTGRSWHGFLHRARQGWHVLMASVGRRQVPLWTDD
ncbi:MAG: glycosyl transferase [Armatimonadota bacterium]